MPFNSQADMVHLLAEWYDTKSNIKLGGFQSQLQASYMSSHTVSLYHNSSVSVDDYIYIFFNWSFLKTKYSISFLFKYWWILMACQFTWGYFMPKKLNCIHCMFIFIFLCSCFRDSFLIFHLNNVKILWDSFFFFFFFFFLNNYLFYIHNFWYN